MGRSTLGRDYDIGRFIADFLRRISALERRLLALASKVTKGDLVINVKDYGAVGDGVTDDRLAIQAALNAAPGTAAVLLPPGDYLIGSGTSLDVPADVFLIGQGQGVSRLIRGGSGGNIVTFVGGSLGVTEATLTANAAVGASTLTVDSTATIAAGDWLLLTDDRPPDPAQPTWPGGELVMVASVASGTSLVLRTTSPTADQTTHRGVSGTFDNAAPEGIGAYLVAQNAKLVGVTLADGAALRNLSLINPTPGTGNGAGVNARFTSNVVIEDVEISGMDGTGIVLGFTDSASIRNCQIHDLVDDPGNSRFGYGIDITGASQDAVISGCSFDRLRHGVTTNGHTSGGIPRRITVADCRSLRSHHSSFDTHGAAYQVLFTDCVSVESAQYGFTARGRDITYRGCEAIRPSNYGFNVGTVPARRIVIDSCVVRDGGSAGIQVSGDGIDDVYVTNTFVDGCAGNGALLGFGNARQTITDCLFFNIGQGGAGPYYGISFATGALGGVDAPNTLISGNLFVKNKVYGAATDYNAAVNIPNVVLTSVVVMGTRAFGIFGGGNGFILDGGTTTILWDNARPGGTNVGVSGTGATTAQLNSITSQVNLTKRRSMTVFNITTGKPVWASADGAGATWVDATGAVAHTPV